MHPEQSHSLSDDKYTRCPCLTNSPYSEEAKALVNFESKANSDWDIHKILAVYRICFHYRKMEETLPDDPAKSFADILIQARQYLEMSVETCPPFVFESSEAEKEEIEDVTADHYGNLFSFFNDEKYYEEPSQLLGQRLERNGFDLSWLNGKRVLDGGCGNGRYTYALKKLGAGEVVGLDMSDSNLADANKRLKGRPLDGVSYKKGSVLEMPFEDESFDYVFSNGVLHHTTDLDKGLDEVVRVMKKGAKGFLMLINAPGGIKWDMIEICRELLRDVPYRLAHDIFLSLNMPTNLRFLYLDHILVPVNIRLTSEEIASKLEKSGASNIVRYERGADVDEFEKFGDYAGKDVLWGSGIHRFYFEKSA